MSEWGYIKKRIIKMPLGIFIILFYNYQIKIYYSNFLKNTFYPKDRAATQIEIELPPTKHRTDLIPPTKVNSIANAY